MNLSNSAHVPLLPRLRLLAASVLLRIARALLHVNASLIAGLPEAPSPVTPSCTEPPGIALEAKNANELVAAIERFSAERAVDHPAEALFLGLYVTRMSAALAPYLARITESQPTPPASSSGDAVN